MPTAYTSNCSCCNRKTIHLTSLVLDTRIGRFQLPENVPETARGRTAGFGNRCALAEQIKAREAMRLYRAEQEGKVAAETLDEDCPFDERSNAGDAWWHGYTLQLNRKFERVAAIALSREPWPSPR